MLWRNLIHTDLIPVIHELVEKGTPFLGICLGLQLIFEAVMKHREWKDLEF